nr:BREX protein BrxB domain-containing protein [Candidatus Chloroploca mongolica]
MRISVFRDLPFAILRYDPADEWKLRHEARLLASRLAASGREVVPVSFADLLWEALEECEGVDAVIRMEQRSGFPRAQEQVTKYLSDPLWAPLPDLLARKLALLDPRRQIAFLTRTAAMAPHIYFMSMLLDQMKGRTEVPSILFYPGAREGENQLRFMNLPSRDALGTYRVKIYG